MYSSCFIIYFLSNSLKANIMFLYASVGGELIMNTLYYLKEFDTEGILQCVYL